MTRRVGGLAGAQITRAGMSQRAFALALKGSPSLAEPLGAALWAQWKYGFPIVPKPGLQLTHGFFHYPAGMQPLGARHLLEVLPPVLVPVVQLGNNQLPSDSDLGKADA